MLNTRNKGVVVTGLNAFLCLVHSLIAFTTGCLVAVVLYQYGVEITRLLVLALWFGSFPVGWCGVRLVLRIPACRQYYQDLPSRLRWQEMLVSHVIIGALIYGALSIELA